jgi:hypothetical protein
MIEAGKWETRHHPKVRASPTCLGCGAVKGGTWLVCYKCYVHEADGSLWISEELAVKIELAERFNTEEVEHARRETNEDAGPAAS